MFDEKKNEKDIWDFKSLTKEEILEQVKSVKKDSARNLMGCLESWYNPYFAIREAFGIETLEKMGVDELRDLLKLASVVGEGLY